MRLHNRETAAIGGPAHRPDRPANAPAFSPLASQTELDRDTSALSVALWLGGLVGTGAVIWLFGQL